MKKHSLRGLNCHVLNETAKPMTVDAKLSIVLENYSMQAIIIICQFN